ncbi:hypothetical protein JCM24511_08251 [Saitozyma sp. JCM 24511]|nr:hypothetical protein JCM24511_08251 [Saitozyma sp. JCM 24511]
MFKSTIVALFALSTLAIAAPAPAAEVKRQSNSGQATYFEVGLGACGWTNTDSDSIVALNAAQYSGGADCGKSITITNTDNGQTATATIVDECPGCGSGSLDLSPSLFSTLTNGDMGLGVFPITWSFN